MNLVPLSTLKNVWLFSCLCTSILIVSCNNNNRKAEFEQKVTVHVGKEQQTLSPDELLHLRNDNFADYSKKFKDSTIFIKGTIQHVDIEEGEILLENSCDGCNVVCLPKDKTVLPLLHRSDLVLLKGICHIVSGDKLVLIVECEMVQFSAH